MRKMVAVIFALCGVIGQAEVLFNEIMASNGGEWPNAAGEAMDWIELYNPGLEPVDLTGWRITDTVEDPWSKWKEIPDGATVPAQGFLLLWGHNKDFPTSGDKKGFCGVTNGEYHVKLGLSSSGETIALAASESDCNALTFSDVVTFGNQFSNVTYGRDPTDVTKWLFFTNATPGSANGADGLEEYPPEQDPLEEESELEKQLQALGLPILRIDTVNGEEPSCETVPSPEGCVGGGIKNATKVPGSLCIKTTGGEVYNSGDYVKKTSGMTLKIRGNTSAYAEKKPYKIKLQKAADLLLRGDDEKYADTEWVLLASANSLNNVIGFTINDLVGLQWTPSCQYVNLMVNGTYRGVYLLCEGENRNQNCRINVAEDGFLFEMDAYWWNEDVYFKTPFCVMSEGYTLKYPDSDDVTAEQVNSISNTMVLVENSIADGSYTERIDVDSFAAWLLGHDILGSCDPAGSNIYFTKYDSGQETPVCMANLWDFDSSYGCSNQWAYIHFMPWSHFSGLCVSQNHAFNNSYRRKWKQVRAVLCEKVAEVLDGLESSGLAAALEGSWSLEQDVRGTGFKPFGLMRQETDAWFSSRVAWIDAHIGEMPHDPEPGEGVDPQKEEMPHDPAPGETVDETIEAAVVCRLGDEYWIRTDIGVIPVELINVNEAVMVSVKGLPPGVKFTTKDVVDGKAKAAAVPAQSIYGSPTKSGIYTVTITVTPQDRKSAMRPVVKSQIVVVRGMDEYVFSTVCDAALGTANGSKVCKTGKKVSIGAKPAKGSVFLGWYEDSLFAKKAEWLPKGYLTASQTFVAPSMDLKLFARFAKLENWAVGTFDGIFYAADSNACGTVTFTVSSKGKVSGKLLMSGQSVVFRASAIDDVREIDGAVFFVAHPTIKVNGTAKTLELIVGAREGFGLGSAAVSLGGDGCAMAVQNGWTLKPAVFPSFPSGKSALTLVTADGLKLKFGAKGAVSVNGTVGVTKVSKKAQILPVAWADADRQALLVRVCAYVAPKRGFDGFCKTYDIVLKVGVDKKGKLIFDSAVLNVLSACLGD